MFGIQFKINIHDCFFNEISKKKTFIYVFKNVALIFKNVRGNTFCLFCNCANYSPRNFSSLTLRDYAMRFYRAMHFSAKRGIAVVCRPSVCLSVTFRYRDHIGWNSSKIISRPNSLGPV